MERRGHQESLDAAAEMVKRVTRDPRGLLETSVSRAKEARPARGDHQEALVQWEKRVMSDLWDHQAHQVLLDPKVLEVSLETRGLSAPWELKVSKDHRATLESVESKEREARMGPSAAPV